MNKQVFKLRISSFSFPSPNSSFIEIIRKHIPIHSVNNEQSCTTNPYINCSTMEQIEITTSADYSFTYCNWTDCSSFEAGAIIFRDKTSSSLNINQCTFTHCISTNTNYFLSGGAINAYNVYSVSVSSTSFILCKCTVWSGGGISMTTIHHQPYLDDCDFISCFAADDGAGVHIWNSSAADELFCKNCRFIYCCIPNDATITNTPTGGGIIEWSNYVMMRCTNMLCFHNEGTYGGGYATTHECGPSDCLLAFCFFHKNTGTFGNDVYFHSFPSGSPALFCFSTAKEKRIGFRRTGEWDSTDADWLPPATIIIYFFDYPASTKYQDLKEYI